MEFRDDAKLDTSQVEDVRGRRGGGMSLPGGGLAAGGGGIGLIIAIIAAVLFGGNLTGGSSSPFDSLNNQSTEGAAPSDLAQRCQTGADANKYQDCRIVGVVNSVQRYWTDEFARRGQKYPPAPTQFFSGQTNTGCGAASSEVGPFYCPNDQKVYIDLSFYEELPNRFGASGGPFAQAYVIAHEYGHHIENLTGVLERAQDRDTGPQSAGVRVELQADCLAGVWANHAVQTGYINPLTDQDINDGLSAAAAVGDDRIQKAATGRVNPEKWTHGSAEQRQRWFRTGYQSGSLESCDTFKGQV